MSRRIITKADVTRFKDSVSGEAKPDDFSTRLIKLIPSEIIVVYVFIAGVIEANSLSSVALYWLIFIVLLICTPLYLIRVTKNQEDSNDSIPVTQIILATIAFPVWIFSLGGPFAFYSWYNPAYGSILIAFYTLFSTIIVGKET